MRHIGHRVSLLLALTTVSSSAIFAQFPTNNDPTNQIRFDTPAEAESRRADLVDFIWNGGLPTSTPTVTTNVAFPNQAVGIDSSIVARVDRLDANVSNWDFHSISYLMHPTNTANANRLAIVHQGHANDLEAGVGATANHLLQHGFTVLAMKMPLYGWNTDTTALVAGQVFRNYANHDQMISNTGPTNGGWGYRLFLEPVVQGINHVIAANPALEDVSMVGLSGGGWTTSLMSAIDPRISLSIPVAGSAPLYVRNVDPASVGDAEQYYSPLYDENIQPDGTGGGVATWMEIYALGGHGEGRRQIKVTNQFDNCCFAGTYPDTYKTIVTDKVESLGSGQWEHVLDSSHHVHQISGHILSTVIDPAFGIDAQPPPGGLPIVDDFDDQNSGVPIGWSIDPSSGGGTSAVENGGSVAIQGPGLASIVYNAPFNAQINKPIEVSLNISSASSDNFLGIFLTDNIGSRAFHLGPLLNVATKQLALNADNGNGFNVSSDRVTLGTVPGYSGGEATLSLTFETEGFSVSFDAGAGGSYSSGQRPWSQIPGGFDPAKLGEFTQLFIQSFDVNGGTPANLVVDSVSVRALVTLAGDYNDDGGVDLADYALWRNYLGAPPGTLPNDPDGGPIGQAQYGSWRANFGGMSSGNESTGLAVPETRLSTVLAVVALTGIIRSRKELRAAKS